MNYNFNVDIKCLLHKIFTHIQIYKKNTITGRARNRFLPETQVFDARGRKHEGAREQGVDCSAVRTRDSRVYGEQAEE